MLTLKKKNNYYIALHRVIFTLLKERNSCLRNGEINKLIT